MVVFDTRATSNEKGASEIGFSGRTPNSIAEEEEI